MRKDLSKQLCERERIGSKSKYRLVRKKRAFNYRLHDEDTDAPSKERMMIRYGWAAKSLNENLNPLWGSLRKAVGRKWDNFYSELTQVFDRRSVVNNHIFEHLYQKILINTFIDDNGNICAVANNAIHNHILEINNLGTNYIYADYYVHPTTGIICKLDKPSLRNIRKSKAQKQKEELLKKCLYDSENKIAYHKIGDTWFAFDMKPAPENQIIYLPPEGSTPESTFDFYGSKLTWDRLPQYSKSKIGRRVISNNYVKDEFFKISVFRDKLSKKLNSLGKIDYEFCAVITDLKIGYYHTNKRTASKKELIDVGVKK